MILTDIGLYYSLFLRMSQYMFLYWSSSISTTLPPLSEGLITRWELLLRSSRAAFWASLKLGLTFCYCGRDHHQHLMSLWPSYVTMTTIWNSLCNLDSPLLHITINITTDGLINTSLYRKPTTGNTILHAQSAHPQPLIQRIPFSQYCTCASNAIAPMILILNRRQIACTSDCWPGVIAKPASKKPSKKLWLSLGILSFFHNPNEQTPMY